MGSKLPRRQVPAVVNASDGKVPEEAKKVVEQPKPPEPRFKLYGWIEGGIIGNPASAGR